MFSQNCFIKKNTPELRERLKSIGYSLNHGKVWGAYLCCFRTYDTNEDKFVASPKYDLDNMPEYKKAIDCGINESLFIAIASLRDNTDKGQWFVTNSNDKWTLYNPKLDLS